MSEPRGTSRRQFTRSAAAAAVGFTIVPRHVLGGPGQTPPSDTLTKAIVGVGGMGRAHFRYPGSVLRAVCDVDREHLASALEIAGPDVTGYTDFREVLERPDIDIVHIATPPHWHALMSVAAAEAGKDIWCEKPMTRTIAEGRAVIGAVERRGRIFRVNTWYRFRSPFYGFRTEVAPIRKAVQDGLLGWPIKATVSATTGFDWKFFWTGRTSLSPEPVPPELDYDFWLGPAPYRPYHPHRVHGTFRGYWDYDGGGLGDMGMHYLDPVQYILDKDETSPVEVWADCPQQHPDACGSWRRIEMKYADGCRIVLDGENRDTEAPFLEGPGGEGLPRPPLGHPPPRGEDRQPPRPPAPHHRLQRGRPDAAPIRPARGQRPPLLHPREPRQDRRAARPAPALRPGGGALRRRRRGQPPGGPAHASTLAAPGLAMRGLAAMKRASIALLLLVASAGVVGAAPSAPTGGTGEDPKDQISRILDRFPARDTAARDGLCAEILALGPEAVGDVCARVLPLGEGDDSRARYAVNALAVCTGRPGDEEERARFARVLLDTLGETRDETVAAFILSQVRLVGRQESIRPLEAFLVHERLGGPAAAALVSIGGPDAEAALLGALGEAPRDAQLVLIQSLGEARSREAVSRLTPLADSGDEGIRQAALYALANIGDPAAGPVLSRARVASSPRERGKAPSLYLLYARRLLEGGQTAEGLEAARAMLESYRRPEESQHASEALALVVSTLGERALPDLLSAADSSDRRFRGSALALAASIPGEDATRAWVDKGRASAPELQVDILAMLAERGGRGGPAARSRESRQRERGRAAGGHPRGEPTRRRVRPACPAPPRRLRKRGGEDGGEDGSARLPR